VTTERSRTAVLLTLLVAAIVLYFVNLDVSAIWDANEAFYAETPREMIERGDYINPTFNYEPRINKPVLSYWIVAAAYRVFGISVGVQRLTIALGGVVLILVAFGLGRLAASVEPARSETGLSAALGLAVAPRLVMFARRIFVDIYISMFLALTLLCFALAERFPERRRAFLLLMYASVGFGVLTKGPVAVLLPGMVCFFYLVVHRELRRTADMMLPAGAAIVLAIVIPWYVGIYLQHGAGYLISLTKSFVIGENVARYTTGLGVRVERPFWWYIPVVFSDSFPWSVFLVPAALVWLRDRRSRGAPDAAFRTRTLLWLWILLIVAFFSASAAKQDLYIFPIVPAVAALSADAIRRATSAGARVGSAPVRSVPVAAIVAGGVLALVGGGLMYLFQSAGSVYALDGMVAISIVAIGGGAAVVVLAWRGALAPAVTMVAASVLVLDWLFVVRTLPSFEPYKPVPGFANALNGRLQSSDVVATYDVAIPSLVFYLRRHVQEVFSEDRLVELLQSPAGVYAVLPAEDYEQVRSRVPASCVVDRRRTFDVKLKNVLARDPLPELVLVANRCDG
jgi:4-amino-4-deoxy-L-arabinose transferase-like glycosyltransferase